MLQPVGEFAKDELAVLKQLRRAKNTTKYKVDLQAFWLLISGLVPETWFEPYSLQKINNNLERRKTALKSEIRFSDSILRNDHGVVLTAAAGNQQADLFEDKGASESVQAFISNDGYCDQSNVWWLKQKDGVPPSREIHLRLAGELNEFAVTATCSKADYNHVLDRMLFHAK